MFLFCIHFFRFGFLYILHLMKVNRSPWIDQLQHDRITQALHKDLETDIVIIGAGIAGIATAFFLLKYTNKNVTLLERNKLAHGATGHNAGQVVSYFERGFSSLVDEFGLSAAAHAQKAIEDAWMLIDEMYTDSGSDIPFSRFLGHAGLSGYDQIIFHLKNNALRKAGGLNTEYIVIADDAECRTRIPREYSDLYQLVPRSQIQSMLEMQKPECIAVVSYQKGCINSALFCQEVLHYLQRTYQNRFSFFEHTFISKIVLHDGFGLLDAQRHTITAQKIVLCTNGFKDLLILDQSGMEVNTRFHHTVSGTIGYMSGYLEKSQKPPTAISYFLDSETGPNDPYFYVTRRYYKYQGDHDYSLVSVGGPERTLTDDDQYASDHEYSEEISCAIDRFVKRVYHTDPAKQIDYLFTWHGLMGYTKNGVRLIGLEPKNHVLCYNLGCNGIGILPSVYGGKRIGDLMLGVKVEPSIFDVPEEFQKK
jgi:glycine/D-amino acid oxidase-like deaminating enzyme